MQGLLGPGHLPPVQSHLALLLSSLVSFCSSQPAFFQSVELSVSLFTSGLGPRCSLCPRCLTYLLFSHLPSKLLLMLRSQLDHYFFKASLIVRLDEVSGDFPKKPYFSFQLSSHCVLWICVIIWWISLFSTRQWASQWLGQPTGCCPPHSTESDRQ